jgi:hypothetical protein
MASNTKWSAQETRESGVIVGWQKNGGEYDLRQIGSELERLWNACGSVLLFFNSFNSTYFYSLDQRNRRKREKSKVRNDIYKG